MYGMLYIQEWTEWAVKLWGKFREMRRERIRGSRGGGESKSKGGGYKTWFLLWYWTTGENLYVSFVVLV